MKHLWKVLVFVAELAASIVYGGEPPVITIDGKPLANVVKIEITTRPDSPSPTGREPRIAWSPEWQARWGRAATENHPWHQWLVFAVANPTSAHFDRELFPTLLYQVTGDAAHARQAWNQLDARIQRGIPSQDIIRANWLKWITCAEWLHPALTDAERSQFAAWSDGIAAAVADTPLADSDRLVTAYFGLRIWFSLSGKEPPDLSAMEQRLVEYARLSEGGEWIEGTSYNDGTTTTLMLGLRACRDLEIAVPAELAALPEQFATATRHRWDNTLSHRMTWGAVQVANVPRTGINRGDLLMDGMAAAGLHDMIQRAQAKTAEESGRYWARPHASAYLFYDPYQESPIGEAPLRELLVCKGQQLLFARSLWTDPGATMVMFRCGRWSGAHHPTADAGDFALLRKGEWVIARPRAYSDSLNIDGLGANNSLLLGNQPINFARREMLGAGEVGGACWVVQEHGGPWRHGNARTAEYVHSFKRWLVWLPGQTDTLVIRDLVDISQPVDQTSDRKAYNIGAARQRHAEYIASQATDSPIPLVQWIVHAPVKPEGLEWTTLGGQRVRVTGTFRRLPDMTVHGLDDRLIDETNHYTGVDAKEIGWQIRRVPTGFSGGQLEMLHTVSVGEGDPPDIMRDGWAVKVGNRRVEFTDTGIEVR